MLFDKIDAPEKTFCDSKYLRIDGSSQHDLI